MAADLAQLPLPVHLRDDATLDNFLFGEALAPLRELLEAQPGLEGEASIFLCGPEGSGRSHLLQGACHALPGGEAVYLPLEQLQAMAPDQVLDGVEHLARVCLDNIHTIAGDADWEQALFHFINRARETGCRLPISAHGTAGPRVGAGLGTGVPAQGPRRCPQAGHHPVSRRPSRHVAGG